MSISVVIPAYHAAETIARAVRSCYYQTLNPLEVIVVIDGSTDDTERIIRKEFPGVKLIVLKENTGVSHARNEGTAQAKGDWVAFLDADDTWHPEKLRILSGYIQEQPEAIGFIHPFATDDFLNQSCPPPYPPAERVSFFKLLFRNKSGGGSSLCLKRDAQLYFNEDFRYCEDHELVLRIAWRGGLYHIPYRLTKTGRKVLAEGGLSGERWEMRKGEMKMYGRLGRLHPLLIPLIPGLVLLSLLKHLWKKLPLH